MPHSSLIIGFPKMAHLCLRLRRSDIDGASRTAEELEPIVTHLRVTWPKMKIIVRGDSRFCRESILRGCEDNAVDYVLGLAKNAGLNVP